MDFQLNFVDVLLYEEPTGGPLLMWGEQGLKAMKGVVIRKVGDEDKEL